MLPQPPYKDDELVKRASGLRDEQDRWNDLFATKLIEVLDKIDLIRSEVRADSQKNRDTAMNAEALITLLESGRTTLALLAKTNEEHQSLLAESKLIHKSADDLENKLASANSAWSSATETARKAVTDLSSAIELNQKAHLLIQQAESVQIVAGTELRAAKLEARSAASKLNQAETALVSLRAMTKVIWQRLVVFMSVLIASGLTAAFMAHLGWKVIFVLLLPVIPFTFAADSIRRVGHEA
jgi:hypothetical protein